MSRRKSKRKVVMFDLDGVLADFSLGFTRLAATMRPDQHVPVVSQRDKLSWHGCGLSLEDESSVWDHIQQSTRFWMDLDPLEKYATFAMIDALQERHDVYFVTKRLAGKGIKMQTETWLMWQGVRDPTVILAADKAAIAEAIGATHSLEDKIDNALAIAGLNGVNSYLIDRPYNQFDHSNTGATVHRIATVWEFIEHIEGTAVKTGAVSA